MSKENKFVLFFQISVSIIGIIFFINQPGNLELLNNNTDEQLNAISSFIVFNFLLYIFGALWSASVFVLIVETYLFIKVLIKSSDLEEEIFEYQMKYSILIGFISALVVLLAKLQI